MGLATAYFIINRHGGGILVDSEPAVGSTFDIFLPASREREAPCKPSDENYHVGDGRILIMDDEDIGGDTEAGSDRTGICLQRIRRRSEDGGSDCLRVYGEHLKTFPKTGASRPFRKISLSMSGKKSLLDCMFSPRSGGCLYGSFCLQTVPIFQGLGVTLLKLWLQRLRRR